MSDVDIDLLADYLGGALDGTPEAARVAALIADDPRWAEAHAELGPAMASVGAELSAWGTAPEPMPADLAVRLENAFAGASGKVTSESDSSGKVAPEAGAASVRHLAVVPSTGSAGKLRRRFRWAVPVAAAAGVLGIAGVGADYLAGAGGADTTAASDSAGAGEQAAPMAAGPSDDGAGDRAAPRAPAGAAADSLVAREPAESDILTSGIDYRRATLTEPIARQERASRSASPGLDNLFRLQVRTALRACLQAIAEVNAGGPVTVRTVDYAGYLGEPALIVRFTAANGSWVWVSGPECGTPAAGADTRDRVRVGS